MYICRRTSKKRIRKCDVSEDKICLQMADQKPKVADDGDKNEEPQNTEPRSSLEDFVTGHYQQQKVFNPTTDHLLNDLA